MALLRARTQAPRLALGAVVCIAAVLGSVDGAGPMSVALAAHGVSPATVACPAAPEPYTGADAVVGELRDLRREQSDACRAVRRSVERVEFDTTHTASALAGTLGVTLAGNGPESRVYVTGDVTGAKGTEQEPSVVQLAQADVTDELVTDATWTMREDLWFLGGLLVVVIVAPLLIRVALP